jgi:hypothetical protein
MHKSKTKWICLGCGENTSKMKEHYFVRSDVWFAAHSSEAGMLCVGCLEGRLGRVLRPDDFTDAHINNVRRNAMSDRLRNRILGLALV